MDSKTLVSLVGAGSGDPELLTVKAIDRLKKADAVFYDALVNPIILSYCRKGVERIPVGKRCGKHSHKQDEINKLLVNRAQKGGRIVRLKGGDPFVFGRGGEELMALTENNIPFEVVPGITAGISVPAYTGIPITHRGVSRSVSFITASTKDHSLTDLPWESFVNLQGTLIFYMGTHVIPTISKKLIEAGMNPNTPACVTTDGTLPSQRTITGSIKEFDSNFTDYKNLSPGLFMVGDVISFLPKCCFFRPTILNQKKVLIVSVDTPSSMLTPILEREGVYVHTFQTAKSEACELDKRLERLKMIPQEGWIVFVSTAAVEHFIDSILEAKKDFRSLNSYKIAAVGKTTTKRLRSYGLIPDFIPHNRNRASMACELMEHVNSSNNYFIVPCSEDDDLEDMTKAFEVESYRFIRLPLYKVSPINYIKDDVAFLKEIGFTHITFSSTKAVDNFNELMEDYDLSSMYRKAKIIAFGPSTENRLKSYGIKVDHVLKKPSKTIMIEAILN